MTNAAWQPHPEHALLAAWHLCGCAEGGGFRVYGRKGRGVCWGWGGEGGFADSYRH